MPRYLIIGCGGSGKSTLARSIAEILKVPYIDTDSMYWQPNWNLRSDDEVVRDLPLDSESWTIDGNFVGYRDRVWAHADHIIWLNYPRACILRRVVRRNLGWWISKKPTWSGNQMPLARCLSGIRHTCRQYRRFQKTFPVFLEAMKGPEIVIFGSPGECDAWVEQLSLIGHTKGELQ